MYAFHKYRELYFSTITCHNHHWILTSSDRIQVILDGLDYLVNENRAVIYAFVIMSNHLHLIWEILDPWSLSKVQHTLLSFTAKQILSMINPDEKEILEVRRSDRTYQIWKRNSLSVAIYYQKILEQKMNYVHQNPIRARIVKDSFNYKYCSFRSYVLNEPEFSFLTLW